MIADIELRMLEVLRQAGDTGVLGYRYRTLETYPEDWDEYLKDKGPIHAPGAWVTFAGWRRRDESRDERPLVELMFGLVVLAENARGETATRHGGPQAAAEPGSYRLIEDAAALLMDNSLGLDIGGLAIGGLRFVRKLPALRERKVSMLALELSTEVYLTCEQFGSALDEFATFHVNWDIPPFGGIDADPDAPGIQIPDDAGADATDHIEVQP